MTGEDWRDHLGHSARAIEVLRPWAAAPVRRSLEASRQEERPVGRRATRKAQRTELVGRPAGGMRDVRLRQGRTFRRHCEQLTLIRSSDDQRNNDWRLDGHTRSVGMRGVKGARDVLHQVPGQRLWRNPAKGVRARPEPWLYQGPI